MTAAKHNDDIFAPASRPPASPVQVLLFLFAFALVAAGFYVMSISFEFGESLTSALLFAAGLILDTVGFALAFISPATAKKATETPN